MLKNIVAISLIALGVICLPTLASDNASTIANNWYPEHIPWYPTHKVRILFVKDGSIDKSKSEIETLNKGSITFLNEVFKKSAISLQAEEAGYGVIATKLTSLNQAVADKEIAALKKQYHADVVYIWSDTATPAATCGVGILADTNQKSYASGSLRKVCKPHSSFVHEIGHNFGLMHTSAAVQSAHNKGLHKWVKLSDAGYGTTSFTTQMAYPNRDGGPRIAIYSNPALRLCKGAPCGNRDTGNAANRIQDIIEKRFGHNKITDSHEPTLKLYDDEFKSSGNVLELKSSQGDLDNLGWGRRAYNFAIPKEFTSVRFYTEKGYQGEVYTPKGNTLIPATHEIAMFKQKMQSVRITEGGRKFVIYQYHYQSGKRMEIETNQPSLGDFNAQMSSFILPRGWRVRFYSEENYQGQSWTVDTMEDRWGIYQTDYIFTYDNKIKSIEILNRPYYM